MSGKKICIRNSSGSTQAFRVPGKDYRLKPGGVLELEERLCNTRDIALLLNRKLLVVIPWHTMNSNLKQTAVAKESKAFHKPGKDTDERPAPGAKVPARKGPEPSAGLPAKKEAADDRSAIGKTD